MEGGIQLQLLIYVPLLLQLAALLLAVRTDPYIEHAHRGILKIVVLTFRFIDGTPVATAWAGRTLGGLLSIRRALHAFADELPQTVRKMAFSAPLGDEGDI